MIFAALLLLHDKSLQITTHKADFHFVEFSGRTRILLYSREKIALNLNRVLWMTNISSGNQPLSGPKSKEPLVHSERFIGSWIEETFIGILASFVHG